MKIRNAFGLCLVLCSVVLQVPATQASDIGLAEMAFNVDGLVYSNGLPAGSSGSAFDFLSGLETLTWSTSTSGKHSFVAFFDLEIDEPTNTYFNENGSFSGTPTLGQSWEIDEPGLVQEGYRGDIYDHLLAGDPDNSTLDNSNLVNSNTEGGTYPNDVSFALGWAFSLEQGSTATITLILSETAPTSGFYLVQADPDSNFSVYFSSSLDIGSTPVPEPSSWLLLVSGLSMAGGLRLFSRRTRQARQA